MKALIEIEVPDGDYCSNASIMKNLASCQFMTHEDNIPCCKLFVDNFGEPEALEQIKTDIWLTIIPKCRQCMNKIKSL